MHGGERGGLNIQILNTLFDLDISWHAWSILDTEKLMLQKSTTRNESMGSEDGAKYSNSKGGNTARKPTY